MLPGGGREVNELLPHPCHRWSPAPAREAADPTLFPIFSPTCTVLTARSHARTGRG